MLDWSIYDYYLLLEADGFDVLPQAVDQESQEKGPNEPSYKTDEKGPADEPHVKDQLAVHGHPEVEEDDAVAGRAEDLDGVPDGVQRARGDVLEGVVSLDEATANQTEDPRPGDEGS